MSRALSFDPGRHPSTRDLPIVPFLGQIAEALVTSSGNGKGPALVLTAEPGAGKSTVVPLWLLARLGLADRKILMLEPRRVAAAAAASRMAELAGEPVGRTVGYRVRLEHRTSRETRIEVVTEALLTRRIQHDPALEDLGLVIFDEFHERSLQTDLAFALALQVWELREDLAVLVMSATIDAGKVAAALGGAPVIACPGKLFPVETRYRPLPEPGFGRDRSGRLRFEEAFAEELRSILEEEHGDLLAFLPGIREIRRTAAHLSAAAPDVEVLALHGSMPLSEQRHVLGPGTGSRRVVISTSVAETSLTVPGIRIVADSGLARLTRFHRRTGMDRLVTERESVHQADQRRGRAGRLMPGIAYRFWDPAEPLPAESPPEILRSDLSGTVLEAAVWGAYEPQDLTWIDQPPAESWTAARILLKLLGAVEDSGRPTERGRAMAELGLPPRLSALLLDAAASCRLVLGAVLAALLDGRDESGVSGNCDLRARLEALRTGSARSGWKSRVFTEARYILHRLRTVTGRSGLVPDSPADSAQRSDRFGAEEPMRLEWSAADEQAVGALLLAGYPDRAAHRTAHGQYRFQSGRLARALGDAVTDDWIVAPDADAGERSGMIYLAAPVEKTDLERMLADRIIEERTVHWTGLRPRITTDRKLGRIVLNRVRGGALSRQEFETSFCAHVRETGLETLPWDTGAKQLLYRIRLLTRYLAERGAHSAVDGGTGGAADKNSAVAGPAAVPSFDDEALLSGLETWLAPFLADPPGAALNAERLRIAIESRLPYRLRSALERECPVSVTLPSGVRKRLTYRDREAPTLGVKIQDAFGLTESPRVCGRPIVLHLLSPAQRPLQITDDLASFWKNTYPEVRREMRGRYPKHRWPENPFTPDRSDRR